jgi:hypothetical protein
MAEIVQIDIPGIGLVDARNAASEKTLAEILKILQEWEKKHLKAGGAGGAGKKEDTNGGGGGDGEDPGAQAPGKIKAATSYLTAKMKFLGGAFIGMGEASTRAVSALANLGDSIESAASMFSSIPVAGALFSAAAGAAEKVVRAFNDASQSGASFGGSLNSFAGAASQAGMTLSEFGSLISRNGQGLLAFGVNTETGAKNFSRLSKTLRESSSELYALGFSTAEINQGLASYGALVRLQGQQGKVSNDQLVSGAKKYMRELDALAKITGEDRKAKEEQMKQLATDAQFQMAMAGKDVKVRDDFMKLIGGFGPKLGGFVKDYIATGTLTTEANQKIGAMLGGEVMNELTVLREKMNNNQRLTDEEQDRLKSITKKAAEAQAQNAGTALAASRDMDDASGALIEGMQIQEGAHKAASEAQKAAKNATDKTNEAVNKMRERIASVSNAFTMFLVNSGALDQLMKAFEILVGVIEKFAIPIINLMMGVITIAVDVLGKLANMVLPILTQAFGYLTSGLTSVVGTIDNNVNPAFSFFGEVIQTVGDIIETYVKPALINFAAFIVADVWPVLKFLGETIMDLAENVIWPAFQLIGGVIRDYVYPAFSAVAGFIADNLFPILTVLAGGFAAYYAVVAAQQVATMYATAKTFVLSGGLAQAAFSAGAAAASLMGAAKAAFAAALPFLAVIAPVVAIVGLFAYLYKTGWSFGDVLEAMGDNLKRFAIGYVDIWLSIAEKIAKFFGGGDKITEMRKGLEQERKELDEKEKLRDQRRADREKERGFQDREKVADQMSLKLGQDNLNLGQKQLGLQKEQIAATEKELNLSGDPHALLKGLAAKEGSGFIKNPSPNAAATPPRSQQSDPGEVPGVTVRDAESARRTMETEAEKQRAEEKKLAEDKARQQAPGGGGSSTPASPGERPTTVQETLIASINRLNNNMENMVAQQAKSNALLDNSLSVQKNLSGSLSGDLFAA